VLLGSLPGENPEGGQQACRQWIEAAMADPGYRESEPVLKHLAQRLKGGGL